MIDNLPKPIAIYIAAENRGDTEALAQCFAEAPVMTTILSLIPRAVLPSLIP
jgi:hypothetical protein